MAKRKKGGRAKRGGRKRAEIKTQGAKINGEVSDGGARANVGQKAIHISLGAERKKKKKKKNEKERCLETNQGAFFVFYPLALLSRASGYGKGKRRRRRRLLQ